MNNYSQLLVRNLIRIGYGFSKTAHMVILISAMYSYQCDGKFEEHSIFSLPIECDLLLLGCITSEEAETS